MGWAVKAKPNSAASLPPVSGFFFLQLLRPICLECRYINKASGRTMHLVLCLSGNESKERDDAEMSSPVLASYCQVSLQLFISIIVKLLRNKMISAFAETWKFLTISSLLALTAGRGVESPSAEPLSAEPAANHPKGLAWPARNYYKHHSSKVNQSPHLPQIPSPSALAFQQCCRGLLQRTT